MSAAKFGTVRFEATNSSDRRRCTECRAIVARTHDALIAHAATHGAHDYSVEPGVRV